MFGAADVRSLLDHRRRPAWTLLGHLKLPAALLNRIANYRAHFRQ